MKNGSGLIPILFFILIIILFIHITNGLKCKMPSWVDENTSVIRMNAKSEFKANIIPIDKFVTLNVTLTNCGPSDSGKFLITMYKCSPPECIAEEILKKLQE